MSEKLTTLPAGSTPVATDLFLSSQNILTTPASKKVTAEQIKNYVVNNTGLTTGVVHSNGSGVLTSSSVTNAETTATSANTASAIVARDGSGNFSAGTITAAGITTTGLTTGVVHSNGGGTLSSSLIVNADVNAAAAIVDTKLATISTAGKVSNSATTATSANTASTIVVRDVSGNFVAGTITASLTGHASLDLPLAGGTLTGALVLSGDGVNPLDAVTVQQLASVAGGFSVKSAALVGTTTALTVSYSNGAAGVGATLTNAGTQAAISIDGVSLSVNDRVLVKNQASSLQNGLYQVATVGSGATNWVLIRTTDYDAPSEMPPGSLIPISSGTSNANSSWFQSVTVTTIGTDPITYTQFTANPADFLKKANNLSDLTNTATAVSNLGLNAGTQALSVGALTATSITDSGLSTGVVHSNGAGLFSSSLVTNADIDGLANIADTKLATISTIGKVDNAATSATSTNTPSTIVARNGSGATSVGALTTTAMTNTGLSTGVVHSDIGGVFSSSTIVNADVDAAAGIVDTKLATIATAGKVSNSATTATSANTASAIVARDGSGNFSAGTITATVTGASSLNVLKAGDTMTGALTINPTTNQLVLGGVSAGTTTTITSTAPAANRVYTIADAGGAASFVMTAGNQTIAGNKTLSGSTTLSALGLGILHSSSGGALTSSTIVNADVDAAAAIVDTKLATIATAGKVSNSATTATTANTASAIVARDSSGNFTCSKIFADNMELELITSDVSATRMMVLTDSTNNISYRSIAVSNTANNIVARDGSGSFQAGTITAALTGAASSNVLKAGDTMTGALTINPTTNQLVLGGVSAGTTTTISATAPASNRTVTIPDFGGSGGNFVLTSNTTKTISTGTWTPVMGDLTNNFTLSTALGFYSRIGDTVFYSTQLHWSSKGSATGALFISLPFTTTSITGYRGNGVVTYTSGVIWTQASKDTFLSFAINDNVSNGQLLSLASDGTAGGSVLASGCSSTGDIQVSGFFRTA